MSMPSLLTLDQTLCVCSYRSNGDAVYDLVRTCPPDLKLMALNASKLASAQGSLEALDAAMSHLTALTGVPRVCPQDSHGSCHGFDVAMP